MTNDTHDADKPQVADMDGIFTPSRPGSRLQAGTGANRPQPRESQREARPDTAEPEAYADPSRAERDMIRREQLADRAGFHSRQPAPMMYVHRRRKITSPEPQIPLSMRVPMSIHARFLLFVERSGSTSYWDALERLMDAAGVAEDGNLAPGKND